MVDLVTSVSLWELVKHAGSWVVNLKRASTARKKESVNALRQVILAAQETSVYVRQINETGRKDHKTEAELSKAWTELSFRLEDLGIEALAQRCRMKGKHWAAPGQFESAELEKADIGLEKMESLASEILSEIRS
ncbi:hypothetical protein IDSA_05560 [Pseudidiomarina salinarum]|uniref:Uncharacterized protein n=1 Tax=Pseudidiomarina salinarum TaxID=435908 RepID=A0A094JHV8_9GAMM|nr:hypothetical protein [Pseudidiomarina salinarum]KFZ32131.1 hypothetical protein IDSA_05560 [Pseudidiomarina salinarum]RUO70081.1 hypothetical protein CWI79_01030 [Pseudidiomarina salinarum]